MWRGVHKIMTKQWLTPLMMFAKHWRCLQTQCSGTHWPPNTLASGWPVPTCGCIKSNLHTVPTTLLLNVPNVFPSIVVIEVTIVSQYHTTAKSMTTSIMLAKQWQHQGQHCLEQWQTSLLRGGQSYHLCYPHSAALDSKLSDVLTVLLLAVLTVFPSFTFAEIAIVSQYCNSQDDELPLTMLAKRCTTNENDDQEHTHLQTSLARVGRYPSVAINGVITLRTWFGDAKTSYWRSNKNLDLLSSHLQDSTLESEKNTLGEHGNPWFKSNIASNQS